MEKNIISSMSSIELYESLQEHFKHHRPRCVMVVTRTMVPMQEMSFHPSYENFKECFGRVSGKTIYSWEPASDNSSVTIELKDGTSFTIPTIKMDCVITDFNELVDLLLGDKVKVTDYKSGYGGHDKNFNMISCDENGIACSYESFSTPYDADCSPDELKEAEVFPDFIRVFLKGEGEGFDSFDIPIDLLER